MQDSEDTARSRTEKKIKYDTISLLPTPLRAFQNEIKNTTKFYKAKFKTNEKLRLGTCNIDCLSTLVNLNS